MLLTGEDIAHHDAPRWVEDAHAEFVGVLLDPEYPCYFAGQAERQGHLRYSFVVGDDLTSLPSTLARFAEVSRTAPRNRHVLTVFFDETTDLDTDEQRFWNTLQWLHERDPAPWPADVPRDPDDAAWEFCFAGEPMFVFPSIPGYRHRRSRGVGSHFALCFQPRRIFAGVERQDPGGEAIRTRIYDRVRRWDDIPPHPDLEFLAYGDPQMREWKQYALPDGNDPLPRTCPLHTA
ncbi:YqcI/YcgG family protein [Amycolatopsis sp. lyj-90]|uniref:YqcI/YcgG family protein n=1 Tax=Amycolatopsis sp. lyj-90 TaxID=2789285 RepID=UPI00397E6C34